MSTRQFFSATLKEPEFPGEATLSDWLYENGYGGWPSNHEELDRIMGCVHAWLTSYAEAGGMDIPEALAELERK